MWMSGTEGLSEKQFREVLKKRMDSIEDSRLFFVLKKMRSRTRLNSRSFRLLKCAVALHQLGIKNVTLGMIEFTFGEKTRLKTAYLAALHRLGDIHCLIYVRGKDVPTTQGSPSVWRVSDWFWKNWDGEITSNE